MLYLRDKHDYGNSQDWTIQISDNIVTCYAERSEVTNSWCWYVDLGDKKIENCDLFHVHGGINGGSNTSIGFDCCHAGDWWPGPDIPDNATDDEKMIVEAMHRAKPTDHYWTFPEVKAETENLARQIFGL